MIGNLGLLFYWRNAEEKPQMGEFLEDWFLQRSWDRSLWIKRGKSMEKCENFQPGQILKGETLQRGKKKKKKVKLIAPTISQAQLSNYRKTFYELTHQHITTFPNSYSTKGIFVIWGDKPLIPHYKRVMNGVDYLKMECHCIIFIS